MLKELDLYEEIDFSEVPPGCQILPTNMDFKTKFNSLGLKIKDKCRLVVLGNLEYESLKDYFSPTAHTKTLNLLLAMAVEHNWGWTVSNTSIRKMAGKMVACWLLVDLANISVDSSFKKL